jgi:hypothetical protein
MIYTGSKRMQRVGMIALGLFVAVVGATPPFASAADGPSDAWLTTGPRSLSSRRLELVEAPSRSIR